VSFTISSAARNFVALLGPDYLQKLKGVKLASISPMTTGALRELHLIPTIEADPHTLPELVQAIAIHR
jgi:uroporphyrinogen-III synthase